MAEKKKKEKTSIELPKAWKSMKHRNETAQAKANYEGLWQLIGVIIAIAILAFILLGGISQVGFLKFIFNWSHNVGNKVSNWLGGGNVIVNEDGVYIDPSGQKGEKINTNGDEIYNPADMLDNDKTQNEDKTDSSTKTESEKEDDEEEQKSVNDKTQGNSNKLNDEVKNE